jgi:hypothetical protein
MPQLGEFGDALGGKGFVNLETVIEQVWRCPWRLRLSKSEMYLEAVID